MLLYLDDDSVRGILIKRLRDEDHDVLTPKAAGSAGEADVVHFMCAIRVSRTFTKTSQCYTTLYSLQAAITPGILVIRRDNDPTRDMSPGAVVRAIHKLAASNLAIPDTVHVLNHWR